MTAKTGTRKHREALLRWAMQCNGYSADQRRLIALAVSIADEPPGDDRGRGPFMRGLAQKICGLVAANEARVAKGRLKASGSGDSGEQPERLPQHPCPKKVNQDREPER